LDQATGREDPLHSVILDNIISGSVVGTLVAVNIGVTVDSGGFVKVGRTSKVVTTGVAEFGVAQAFSKSTETKI
jgi:hypothetical protein